MCTIRFFDAFSGIGGFRQALEGLGWECSGHCEIDQDKLAVYRANFDTETELEHTDIRTLSSLPDTDVLVAGFPLPELLSRWEAEGV